MGVGTCYPEDERRTVFLGAFAKPLNCLYHRPKELISKLPSHMSPKPIHPKHSLEARTLILGSSSKYRHELLSRLQWPFETVSPDIDETPLESEQPIELSQRLALQKAHAMAVLHPKAIVIGSDQVADLHGQSLGKPLTHDKAVSQLEMMSGQTVLFHTSVCVCCKETEFSNVFVSTVKVVFKTLSRQTIESYLLKDKPYDCAGSAKSESLGVALLERIESDDPTSLIGLPLIKTTALLALAGLDVLSSNPAKHHHPL